MTALVLKSVTLISNTSNDTEEEFSIPLNMSDIITVCKEFHKLGWQMQSQVEEILEAGVEEAINSGKVKPEALPHIKDFLQTIIDTQYLGEACRQANDCLMAIAFYEDKYFLDLVSGLN